MATSRRIAGITIQIGADTTKLTSALKGVDRQLKTTKGSLTDINKLLKLNPGNTTLLTQKQKALATAVKATQERLKELKNAQKNVTKDSKDYDNLQREIIETETDLKRLKKEYKNFGSVAGQKIQNVGQKWKEYGNTVKAVGQDLTTKLTLPIVAAFTYAGKSASDYEENLNKIDVAFGDSAQSVKDWSNNALEQYGLSKVAATEAASGFGALAKGIGIAEGDAAEMATTLTGLTADLSSYFNADTETSAKALEGIFTGEAEALKKFGVVMNDTSLDAFAKEQGKSWKDMSQSEKTMLRYQYVMSKTADAQGDYARTSDGTSNSVRTLKSALSDLATAVGVQLLPIITPLVTKLTEIVTKLSELDPATLDIIVKIGLVVAALGPLITVVGNVMTVAGSLMIGLGKIVGFLGPGGLIVAGIAAVVLGGAWLINNWDSVKAKAEELKKKVVAAWNWLKEKLEPIVTGLKDSVVSAWGKIKTGVTTAAEKVRLFVTAKWAALKKWAIGIWTGFKLSVAAIWTNIKTSVSNTVTNMSTAVQEKWNALKSAISTTVTNMWLAITAKWTAIKDSVSDTIDNMKTYWNNFKTWVATIFKIAWGTAWTGVVNKFSTIFDKIKEKAKATINAVIGFLNSMIKKVQDAINTVVDGINSKLAINIPDIDLGIFGTVKGFSWSPNVPKVDWGEKPIPLLAKGGVVQNGGRAIVGEYAPEYLRVVNGKAIVTPMKDAQARMNRETNINNTFNIYGGDKSPKQIADEVSRVLIQQSKQRGLAYA